MSLNPAASDSSILIANAEIFVEKINIVNKIDKNLLINNLSMVNNKFNCNANC